ncbi:MAG TPA: complex I subunit 1 family protein [Oculatellaceae cyanobacterium]
MSNFDEISKFGRLTIIWLSIIFGSVWVVTWLVGIAIPMFLKSPACASLGGGAEMAAETIKALTPLVTVLVFIPINAMFMVLCERRALALFTVRRGPCRTGFDGLAQTAADAVKLLFKEDLTPIGADIAMFTLAPIIFFAPSVFGAIPLLAAVTNNHELFQITNLPTGIFFVLAASAIPVIGIVMGGWASNNKYSLVGGLRSAAQAISYEIPLVMSLITICLLAGSLDLVKIANQQQGGILNWNLFGGGALSGLDKALACGVGSHSDAGRILADCYHMGPAGVVSVAATVVLIGCTLLLAGIYLTGACAEINRIPFDLPEAESELVSGYNTEYSGMKFAIFFLAEFTNLFIVSSIFTVMFLGAGDNPIPTWVLQAIGWPAICKAIGDFLTNTPGIAGITAVVRSLQIIDFDTLFAALWVIAKVYTMVVIAILVRGTLPRFRIDQLLDFGWKRLVPLSLILFLLVVFAREAVVCHG